QPGGVGEDAVLDRALGRRLGQRREFLVGHQARGQRRFGAESLADPGVDVEGIRIVLAHGRPPAAMIAYGSRVVRDDRGMIGPWTRVPSSRARSPPRPSWPPPRS